MTKTKPNILILFTDMQRADTVHALGNATIKTPHLDRLASEGTAFTNCFSPSPVCVPARCCTGLLQNIDRTVPGRIASRNRRDLRGDSLVRR